MNNDLTKKYFTLIMRVLFLMYCAFIVQVFLNKYPDAMSSNIIFSQDFDALYARANASNFIPFKTLIMYAQMQPSMTVAAQNLVGNIFPFIPFGALLPAAFAKFRSIVPAIIFFFCFSIIIEGFAITMFVTDIDFVILNVLGAVIGWYISKVIAKHVEL